MKTTPEYTQHAQNLYHQGIKISQIEKELSKLGLDGEHIELHLKQVKDLRYNKQRLTGFKCIAFGAMLCLAGCLLTLFHDYSVAYAGLTLYGMTISGTCLVLAGLALILGI
jgi:hypothetical protein